MGFKEAYNSRLDRSIFGDHWCGPDRLVNAEWTLVAVYEPENPDEGQRVEVHCFAWPARFYRIKALANEHRPEWQLSTGSRQGQLAVLIAEKVSEGLLDVDYATLIVMEAR